MRIRYVRAGQICVAAALCWAGVAGPSPVAAADAPDVDEILDQIGTSQNEANERHADYVRELETVEASINNCREFFDQHGDDPEVRAIIRRIREQPGDIFFLTDSTDIEALVEAVGGDISLSQQDLEICLRLRDEGVGNKDEQRLRDEGVGDKDKQKPASFAHIAASLDRCLQALEQVGPDPAGIAVLQRVSRRPADPTFTSEKTLDRLGDAVGDLALTPRDLETCADAFHVQAAFEQSFALLGEHPPPCRGNEKLCTFRGHSTCCASDQTCGNIRDTVTCNNPSCFPATATVRLEDGSQKSMRDVRLGDRIMVARADGSLGYEEVYLNTHKDSVSSTPYVELALASGRSLTLSPRHFIPVAAGPASSWADHVAKGANEIAVGDIVWSRADDGRMAPDEVAAVRTTVAVGAYNPLTMNGTIVVDGVVASAHSDWFLDGIVSADAQTKVYQAILAPVRLAYRALGPARMETITEGWGVVDFVREATTPTGRGPGSGWIWPGVIALAALGAAFLWRRRSAAH
jgi:MYXO-CTERM domain-containing protein